MDGPTDGQTKPDASKKQPIHGTYRRTVDGVNNSGTGGLSRELYNIHKLRKMMLSFGFSFYMKTNLILLFYLDHRGLQLLS